MAYAVFADSLHDLAIFAPHLRPVNHVMLAWIVYTAILTLADFLGMDVR